MNGSSVSWDEKTSAKPKTKSHQREKSQKKTDISSSLHKLCPKCALQGTTSLLRLYQLNDGEAISMCKNVKCTFMPSSDWESLVVQRNSDNIPSASLKKSISTTTSLCASTARTSPSLRSRSVNDLTTPSLKNASTASWVSKLNSEYTSNSTPSSSRAQSPVFSESGERGHKSLVPVGPFLQKGQAHSYSSFDTRHIEYYRPPDQFINESTEFLSLTGENRKNTEKLAIDSYVNQAGNISKRKQKKGKSKKPNSLGSDSLSSRSEESNLRPLTPDSFSRPSSPTPLASRPVWPPTEDPIPLLETEPESLSTRKNIKRIFVSAETLTRLTKGHQPFNLAGIKKPKIELDSADYTTPLKTTIKEPLQCDIDGSFIDAQSSVLYSPTSPPEAVQPSHKLSSLEKSNKTHSAALAGQFSVVIAGFK